MKFKLVAFAAIAMLIAACSTPEPEPVPQGPIPLTEQEFRDMVVGTLLTNPGDALSDTRLYHDDGSLDWTGEKVTSGSGTWSFEGSVLVTNFDSSGHTATVCEHVLPAGSSFRFERTACP